MEEGNSINTSQTHDYHHQTLVDEADSLDEEKLQIMLQGKKSRMKDGILGKEVMQET
jgi:hypothetical protein